MRKGDVVLFDKTGTIIGKAISLVTKCKYTHAGIIYSVNSQNIIIAEALNNGFVLKKYKVKKFIKKLYNEKIILRRSEYKLKNIQNSIEEYLGKDYSFSTIFKILWRSITKQELSVDKEKTVICSEVVGYALLNCNSYIDFSEEYNKAMDYITPADLCHSKLLRTV